jgi:transcriptional regulator with XRE-family HTH domain
MDVRRQLGLNIQRLRRAKEWSQEELAFESGIHRTYISGLERGVRNPTITVVQRLAETLKVPSGALLDPPARKAR